MTGSNIQPDDYISFAGLRSFITGILRLFFRICRLMVRTVERHYWLLTGGIVAGCLSGWLYHSTFGGRYKVSMIVEYRALDKTIYRNIVNDMNRMVLYNSKEQTAARLGLPVRLVERVIKLGTADLNGKPLTDDPNSAYPLFQITGELRSPGGEDTLARAVVNYINGLPFLQSEITEQMNIRAEQLSHIAKEMAGIDSLHKDGLPDPAAIYRHSYTLDSLRAAIRRNLIHADKALSPVTEFRAPDRPQSAPIALVVIFFAVVGFLIALLVALLNDLYAAYG